MKLTSVTQEELNIYYKVCRVIDQEKRLKMSEEQKKKRREYRRDYMRQYRAKQKEIKQIC